MFERLTEYTREAHITFTFVTLAILREVFGGRRKHNLYGEEVIMFYIVTGQEASSP